MSESTRSDAASAGSSKPEVIQLNREDVIRLLSLCDLLLKHYASTASPDSMPGFLKDHDILTLGEARYCCHYTNPISPGTQFCKSHTSYLPISLAKAWCIANASGDSSFDHIQKGPCQKDGGDKCDFID